MSIQERLLNQIEQERHRLSVLAARHDFDFLHPDVVKQSQWMDTLILLYQSASRQIKIGKKWRIKRKAG